MHEYVINIYTDTTKMTCFLQLYGLEDDLHMEDSQYLLCLSLFFIPYALLEVSYDYCTLRNTEKKDILVKRCLQICV